MNKLNAFPHKAMHRRCFRSFAPFLLPLLLAVQGGCAYLPFTGDDKDAGEQGEARPEIAAVSVQPPAITFPADSIPLIQEEEASLPLVTPWIDSLLAGMTDRQRIAQLLVPFSFSDLAEKTLDQLRIAVKDQQVGAVLLSRGTLGEARQLLDSLQSWARVPLLVSADFETGPGRRFVGALELPSMMALGATRDPQLAYRAGRAVAEESRDIGVHINFAPVADINSNPRNPIINTRSFGEDRGLVARMTEAFTRGLQDGGMIATPKHFPGHGDTETDSHSGLPVIHATRERMDSLELYPFRRLVRARAMAMMTAHIAVPSLTGDSALPATFSRVILDSLLRGEMGFSGLIVTDALNMKALSRGKTENIPAAALAAGADLLLIPADIDATIDSVIAARARGEIDSVRLLGSVRRVLALKEWVEAQSSPVDSTLTRLERAGRHRRLADHIAERAVTQLRNVNETLPIELDGKTIGIVNLVRRSQPGAAVQLARELEKRGAAVHMLTLSKTMKSRDWEKWKSEQIEKLDVLLISSFITIADGSGNIAYSDAQNETLEEIAALELPRVLLAMGSPYVASSIGGIPAVLLAYGRQAPSVRAVARILAGEIEASGTLPVSIPGLEQTADMKPRVSEAERRQLFSEVDNLVMEQIKRASFPGGQLLVLRCDRVVYDRCYGAFTYDSNASPVTAGTLYDLASLTKVVATTPAAMRLVDEGRLHLDSTVAFYLPKFAANGKEHITIRNLLMHNSGLEAYRLFYLSLDNEQDVIDNIFSSELAYATGSKTVYSDLGMITLGKVIERITGMTLDSYVRSEFYDPLGMHETMFNPPDSLRTRIAPTEVDGTWRKRLIHGTVHDPASALLGGVAGHAGLFSSARSLLPFVRMMLHEGTLDSVRYIDDATLRLFTTRQSGGSTRALGWDTRSTTGSSSGRYFSMKSYGHTGFTGTSIWIDPVASVAVIFLTNRVHPTAANRQQARFRSVLHDAVREVLTDMDLLTPRR